jgi:Cu-processing system ATP-binding protein
MIKVCNLYKRFKKQYALQGINVEFHRNQVVALIGPNGSGKTTLIKCILGMVYPDKGDIFFDGKSVRNAVAYRAEIGYMPQIGRYPDNITVRQLIRMMISIRHAEESDIDRELMDAFNLDEIGHKTMHSLSGGTRQKVSACLAFMFNPSVLILDEPTAGLDPVSSEILKGKILKEKAKGKSIIITSHILNDIDDLATDVLYLQEGSIRIFSALEEIAAITGEQRLNRSIAILMKNNFYNNSIHNRKIAEAKNA